MRIGYVGLGAMGRELAGRLAGDHDLIVYDLDPGAVARLEGEGAKAAGSLAAMGGECDVVVLCLPKSANVERVLFDDSGLAAAMREGTIVVDQTSGQPGQTRAFAERLARRGITLIDAPVSGGVPLARSGSVTIMASGPADEMARARPVLDAISCNVFHCGDQVGDGQALKSLNNTINSANRAATLEIAAVGRRLGLDLAAMTEAFNKGAAQNFITEKMLPAMVEGTASTDFALALMVKDLNQAADIGAAQAMPMPISDTARGLFNAALRLTSDDARLEDLIPFMERLTGVSFTGECASRADEVGLSPEAAMRLVGEGLAICNRMTMAENLDLALAIGMQPEKFAPAMLAGSARSKAAEDLLAEGGPAPAPDGAAVETLSRLSRIGARFSMPLLMTNQVRAQCLAQWRAANPTN